MVTATSRTQDSPTDTPIEEAGVEDWRESIGDPAVRQAAGKFSSPETLAKSYHELERKLGGSASIPGKDATQADWDGFYNRLGRPESPEGYVLTPPELPEGAVHDDGISFLAGDLFHKHGLSQRQAAGVFADYLRLEAEAAAQQGGLDHEAKASAEAALRRNWGKGYEANVAYANRAFRRYFGDRAEEIRTLRLADGADLGNHPLFVEAFATIGRQMSEDAFRTGGVSDPDAQGALRARLDEMRKIPLDRLSDKQRAEKRQIYVKLYGTAPADGRTR